MMGIPQRLPWTTRSGTAKLVELTDDDLSRVAAGTILVRLTGRGYEPVTVEGLRTGVVDEGEKSGVEPYAVPVIEGRVASGRVLAFDPRELCRVVASRGVI